MIFKLKQYFKSFLIFKQKPLIFLIILPFVFHSLGFLGYFFIPHDSDLWWHLQVGKDILNRGFNYQDIYSYTMFGFEWVDHEWLLNILFFRLFEVGHNFLLLGLFFASVAFIAFYTLATSSLKHFHTYTGQFALWFSLCLSMLAGAMCLGIRAQVIGILGLSILWQIIRKTNWTNLKNIKWLLPGFFLIWANLHGSFIIGLAILGLDFCVNLFDVFFPTNDNITAKQDSISQLKNKLIIGVSCFLVTFINPYFYKTYLEAFRVFTDHYAHYWIEEWKSPSLKEQRYIYWLFYTFTLLILVAYKQAWQKLSKLEICSLIIFFVLACRSIRHINLFSIIALPIYISLLEDFLADFYLYLKVQIDKFQIKKAYVVGIFIAISLFGSLISLDFASKNIKRFLNYSVKQEFYYKDYPEKALDFLQTQKFKGNILAEYGWGGFVLWYSPSYKVFIDGRMPNWPFKNHKTILQVFNELRFPKAFDSESINKYQIEYVLLKKTKNHNKKTYFNWPTVYQDSKSVILKNPNLTTSIYLIPEEEKLYK